MAKTQGGEAGVVLPDTRKRRVLLCIVITWYGPGNLVTCSRCLRQQAVSHFDDNTTPHSSKTKMYQPYKNTSLKSSRDVRCVVE